MTVHLRYINRNDSALAIYKSQWLLHLRYINRNDSALAIYKSHWLLHFVIYKSQRHEQLRCINVLSTNIVIYK